MSYAPMRSMNAELDSGATDGTFKKVVRNRGGFVDAATADSREDLHDAYYGVHECEPKAAPTRGAVRTQNYRPTPPADPWG